jgi:hypothetical protein
VTIFFWSDTSSTAQLLFAIARDHLPYIRPFLGLLGTEFTGLLTCCLRIDFSKRYRLLRLSWVALDWLLFRSIGLWTKENLKRRSPLITARVPPSLSSGVSTFPHRVPFQVSTNVCEVLYAFWMFPCFYLAARFSIYSLYPNVCKRFLCSPIVPVHFSCRNVATCMQVYSALWRLFRNRLSFCSLEKGICAGPCWSTFRRHTPVG